MSMVQSGELLLNDSKLEDCWGDFPGWLNALGVYFKADCILETNFTFPEQSETALWDTIEDHKQ